MSHQPDEVVVPFATFLEARERRRRVSAAFKQVALSQFPDDSPPAAAVAVALAREAVSATARSGFQDETTSASWTPPELPKGGFVLMGDTWSSSAESAGQQDRDADESRRLASDLERYAGWLSKNYVSAAVRAGVAALAVAMDRGSDASLELFTLGKDIGRLPSGDVRTMLRKTLKKLHVALAIAEAT